MDLSEFQKQYHWLMGLREYFIAIDEGDRFEILFKSLYHDNWYRKRDIMTEIVQMSQSNPTHVKSWMNLLLHEKLTDVDIKPQLVVTLLRKFMKEDPLLVNTAKFIDHWSGKDGEAADPPDLNDFFSKGQVQSKLWLLRELKNVVDGNLGNVVFYGGWYNFLAHFIFHNFDVNSITSIDLDENVVEPSKKLYDREYRNNLFVPFTFDVSRIRWEGNQLLVQDMDRREEKITEWMEKQDKKYAETIIEREDQIRQGYTTKEKIREDIFKDKEEVFEDFGWRNIFQHPEMKYQDKVDKINSNENMQDPEKQKLISRLNTTPIHTVINTSCEHMDNSWFENLPDGTFVVLHQNDYFDNEQHSNCCKDLTEVKQKYPMSEIYYEGELDTYLYNRFMLIGTK
jgi:hypothetical protein